MNSLLLGVVIVVAFGIAIIVLVKLSETQQKLASLHQDLRRNELKLELEMNKVKPEAVDEAAEVQHEKDQSTLGEKNVEQ